MSTSAPRGPAVQLPKARPSQAPKVTGGELVPIHDDAMENSIHAQNSMSSQSHLSPVAQTPPPRPTSILTPLGAVNTHQWNTSQGGPQTQSSVILEASAAAAQLAQYSSNQPQVSTPQRSLTLVVS